MKVFGIVMGCFVILFALWFGISYVNYNNANVRTRNQIEAKFNDNANVFDSMWKQIKKTANIAEKEKDAFKEMFVAAMQNRSGIDGRGSFMSMLHEAYPNLPTLSYDKIMNIVNAKHEEFQSNQTILLDMCREYSNLTQTIPARWFISDDPVFRSKYCRIITSTRTTEAFDSGVDDDVEVF